LAIDAKDYVVAVVDDDPRVRESIKDLLASAGFHATPFGSAEEVLEAGALGASCCLITDVRMVGIDGWQLQRIAITNFPNLPIIFITAHQDDLSRQRALNLGAFALIYKPFDGEELLDTVAAAMEQSKGSCNRGARSSDAQRDPTGQNRRCLPTQGNH